MNNQSARELWTPRVRQWQASGLSATAFGKQHNISVSSLYNWASRLRHLESGRKPFPIARVLRREGCVRTPQQTNGSAIVVEIASARVVLTPGFAQATFANVVDVLSACKQRGEQ